MSLNSLVNKKYRHSLNGFRQILASYIPSIRSSRTVEQRISLESEILDVFQQVLNFDTWKYEKVSSKDHLVREDYNDPRRMFMFVIMVDMARIQSISESYLSYLNNQKSDLLELYGKIRRIKQKKATLDLWGGSKDKFLLIESFLNMDRLGNKFINQAECNVDTVAGCLTLPVVGTDEIKPTQVSIGSKSNGVPGSSNLDVNTNNINPSFVFDGNPETWFEYEGDKGPLHLVLICQLPKTEIINQIEIEPVNLGASLNYEIQDVSFSSSDKEVTSLKKMVSGEVEDDYFTIKSSENDSYWSCRFLPVRCQQVAIHLVQNQSTYITAYSPRGTEVTVPKFNIGVRSISFKRNEYSSIGAINSREIAINPGLYAAAVTTKIFPNNEKLYEIYSDLSFDGGENWEKNIYELPEEDSRTVLLDGTGGTAIWRLRLERKDDVFHDVRSLTDDDFDFELKSKQRSVPRNISPVRFSIEERPYNKEVYVIQPKVGRKTKHRKDSIFIGVGKSNKRMRIPLGYSLMDLSIDPKDLHVYVNGIEWNRVDDSGATELVPSAADGEYHLNDEQDTLIFGDSLPDKAVVKFRFDEERVLWEEASDGYYASLASPFDPDPTNIRISGRPVSFTRISKILPKGRKMINLGAKNVVQGKPGEYFQLVSTDKSLSFTETTSVQKLNAITPGASEIVYYLDHKNGMLYLNPAISDTHSVKCLLEHATDFTISKSSVKVITNGAVPAGIRVAKDSLGLITYADGSRTKRDERLDPVTGEYDFRDIEFSVDPLPGGKATILTHDYVVKGSVSIDSSILQGQSAGDFPMVEVEYVDGLSEFIGLIPMENEKTVSIQADASGNVKFKLSAGARVYAPLEVTFMDATVFNSTMKSSSLADFLSQPDTDIGRYYIDYSTGEIYVKVGIGGTLKAGVGIKYSYYDQEFDSQNLYSVDYRNGVLYTAKKQKVSPIKKNIVYKASAHTIAYDLASPISEFSFDAKTSAVEIRTEDMSDINRLVKVTWAYVKDKPSLKELRKFFSPIVSYLGLRFQ